MRDTTQVKLSEEVRQKQLLWLLGENISKEATTLSGQNRTGMETITICCNGIRYYKHNFGKYCLVREVLYCVALQRNWDCEPVVAYILHNDYQNINLQIFTTYSFDVM